ncbi:MAG: hypothetical protein NZM25_10050 [Leptospiraceae bacterium]|nr:hypothetical protein [Leptospiraceae bacterium]MDW8307491.1 hypothetical protein [Leptospiraceae bacterium]
MPWFSAEVRRTIPACADVAFNTICDFESYPQWITTIRQANLLKKTQHGSVVEFHAHLIVRTIRYVLDYEIDPLLRCLRWTFLEGDILSTNGEFLVLEEGAHASLAIYRIHADPGFYVNELLLFLLKETVMAGVLRDLEKEVRRRKNLLIL